MRKKRTSRFLDERVVVDQRPKRPPPPPMQTFQRLEFHQTRVTYEQVAITAGIPNVVLRRMNEMERKLAGFYSVNFSVENRKN